MPGKTCIRKETISVMEDGVHCDPTCDFCAFLDYMDADVCLLFYQHLECDPKTKQYIRLEECIKGVELAERIENNDRGNDTKDIRDNE